MRLSNTVDLGDNRIVTLNELRVKDARNMMASAKKLEKVDVKTLLTERLDEVAGLLGDCVVMPGDESIEDISFSEMMAIKDAFMEVNASFLDLMSLAGLLKTPLTDSTEPVPTSSNEGIPA